MLFDSMRSRLLLVALVFSACGSPKSKAPVDKNQSETPGLATLSGQVVSRLLTGARTPAGGVTVVARGDFDGDGSVSSTEIATTTTNDDGTFALSIDVRSVASVVLAGSKAGLMRNADRYEVRRGDRVNAALVLYEAQALTRQGDVLALPDNMLRIEGLSPDAVGTARVYDPTAQEDAFPGDFTAGDGVRLVSAVFAAYDLREQGTQAPLNVTTDAVMTVAVPRSTWAVLQDMQLGSGEIEVPWWHFDEQTGIWVEDGLATLVDATDSPIDEGELSQVVSGAYDGRIFARAGLAPPTATRSGTAASSSGTVNVDFKQPAENSATGTAKTTLKNWGEEPPKRPTQEDDPSSCDNFFGCGWCDYFPSTCSRRSPVVTNDTNLSAMGNATMRSQIYSADGKYYFGSAYGLTREDGRYDIPLPRSEAPGEDSNNNGITGEQLFARVTLEWQGYTYGLVEGVLPSVGGLSGDVGDVDLTYYALRASPCVIEGVVTDKAGHPWQGAEVYVIADVVAPLADTEAYCTDATPCVLNTQTAEDGSIYLRAPIAAGFVVEGRLDKQEEDYRAYFDGQWHIRDCPTGVLTLPFGFGAVEQTVRYSIVNQTLVWTPADRAVQSIRVYSVDGELKWLVSSQAGFVGPVTYGVAPIGATTEVAANGTLEPSDTIELFGVFADESGFQRTVYSAPAQP